MNEAKTLGELKKSGQPVLTVREEMRKNLVRCLRSGERILPGIVGYDETVIPDIENAILSGHHMVFLGERGQAKSRVIRGLVSLLDERSLRRALREKERQITSLENELRPYREQIPRMKDEG